MKTALTIAGSDSCGGAGIQADIKTMAANGVYAMSAICALTAQNTTRVRAILDVPADFLEKQLDAVFEDIFPDAVKIGMVSSPALISVIAKSLRKHRAANIVIDPVMVATSGARLLKTDALSALENELFPLATLITPNIPEAEALSEKQIQCTEDIESTAKLLFEKYGVAVLLKGGHNICDANDLLVTEEGCKYFLGARINNPNTHGTGCTLSSAIAANLAKGRSLKDSISYAKNYLSGALSDMMNLGHGSGPINHLFDIKSKFVSEV